MKVSLNYMVLIVAALILLSCHATETEIDREEMHSEIKQTIAGKWRVFFDAWVGGDGAACAGYFCEDGIHFRPGANIDRGREAIGETFSQILASYRVEFCNQTTFEIEVCDSIIVEYGTYEQKWAQSEEVTRGGYFAVWRRCGPDSIGISRLIFN
jgi:hypothetical protein